MLCSVPIFNAFYTIRNLWLQSSNANSEAGMRDINAIQVLSVSELQWVQHIQAKKVRIPCDCKVWNYNIGR